MTLALTVESSWRGFLETFEPLRADLYRYCRYLTRSPWDAEDLAQDTLARAFVTLGQQGEAPKNPKAWLFRVASNVWIDQQRRTREIIGAPFAEPAAVDADPRVLREGAGTLIARLSPQERAAVVLADAFDLPIEDIAAMLSTTPNAIKAALHRGRGKVADGNDGPTRGPSIAQRLATPAATERVPVPAALDAFVTAFNAHDLDAVAAVLLDTAIVEVVGATSLNTAKEARERILPGMMFGSAKMAEAATSGAMDARFVKNVLPTPAVVSIATFRGEPVVLSWYAHPDGEYVRAVSRVTVEGDRIVRMRNYFFTPDMLLEVGAELGVPTRSNGHQFCRRDA